MSYQPNIWVDGETPVDAAHMNHIEQGIAHCGSSNPNILHNWYFADPIDQREGYVVPAGTVYFSDTGLVTQVGTVAGYTAAVNVDGTYGAITVDSMTYYVPWSAAVRGHTGNSTYTIDRWHLYHGTLLRQDDGVVLTTDFSDGFYWRQLIENSDGLLGKTVTLSCLYGNEVFFATATLPKERPSGTVRYILREIVPNLALTFFYSASGSRFSAQINAYAPIRTDALKAIKLEFGSVQTLAHKDADGNWVPNDPPPDPALELAKCQRYQIMLGKGATRANQVHTHVVGIGAGYLNNAALILIDLPTSGRTNAPSIKWSGKFVLVNPYNDTNPLSVTAFACWADNNTTSKILLRATTETANVEIGKTYFLRADNDATASLLFDWNL